MKKMKYTNREVEYKGHKYFVYDVSYFDLDFTVGPRSLFDFEEPFFRNSDFPHCQVYLPELDNQELSEKELEDELFNRGVLRQIIGRSLSKLLVKLRYEGVKIEEFDECPDKSLHELNPVVEKEIGDWLDGYGIQYWLGPTWWKDSCSIDEIMKQLVSFYKSVCRCCGG